MGTSMIVALAFQIAGIKPTFESHLVKELTKLAGSRAVASLRNYIDRAGPGLDVQFTFLDAKSDVVARLTGDSSLKDVLISQDGTIVVARVETFTDSKPSHVTDILVVNKDGLVAKTHLLNGCLIALQNDSVLCSYYDMPIIRFGPDPVFGSWTTKKVTDDRETFLYPDGETFWFTRNDDALKKSFASQMAKDGTLQKSIEIGNYGNSIVQGPVDASFLFFTQFHFTGDGFGGYDSLFVKDLESGTVRELCPKMELHRQIWLAGPRCLGYFAGGRSNQKMTFYSPTSGRSMTLGPTLTSASCASLGPDSAIVVGRNNSGKSVIYLMKPGKGSLDKISIAGVSDPNEVCSCR